MHLKSSIQQGSEPWAFPGLTHPSAQLEQPERTSSLTFPDALYSCADGLVLRASRLLPVSLSQLIVLPPFNPQMPSITAGTSGCFLRKQELTPGARPEVVGMIWPAPPFPGREEPAVNW